MLVWQILCHEENDYDLSYNLIPLGNFDSTHSTIYR
jgi:hypothetical protein